MSTICLIDPTVRQARYKRREAQKHFEGELIRIRRFPMHDGRNRLEAWLLVACDTIARIILRPDLTGEQKNAMFRKIVQGYKELINSTQVPIA